MSATTRRIAAAAALLLAWSGASAFDTGHHFDLTGAALREEGFGATSIQAVQVANWLTDYYAANPLSRGAVRTDLNRLHFDNLYGTDEVARYWARLLANAREIALDAARSDDPVTMLAMTGLLLHAVQDFDSHSSWVDGRRAQFPEPFRRETWLADRPPEGARIVTGSYPPYPSPPPSGHPPHGGYDFGLNKDSHIRPMWAEAYVSAYCATHEVLGLLRAWAEEGRPGFWSEIRNFELDETGRRRLDLDVEAARNLSMWVTGKGSEGHWKGGESGAVGYLSKLALEWTTSPPSPIVQAVRNHVIQERLASGLHSGEEPPPLPEVAGFQGDRTVVEVAITYLAETRGGGRRIDRVHKADLYAVTTVGLERYVDRVMRGKKRYPDPWRTIHLAGGSETEIPIRIEVWDQDEVLWRKDDPCDINPAPGKKDLTFTLRLADGRLHGDLEGLYDGPERTFEIAGEKPDEMRVLIRGYVRARKLASR